MCHQPEFQSLPPSQIVPRLADRHRYLASESSFYRILREANQHHRRGRAQTPRQVAKPRGYKADGPNQTWSWDITYLASAVRGAFYRLYLVEDIYSRKIVGWEVHESESAEHASELIRKTCLAEGIHRWWLGPALGQWRSHEGRHHAGDLATIGDRALVQSSVGQR